MKEQWINENIGHLVQDICTLARIPSVSIKTGNPEMPYGKACLNVLNTALDLGRSMGFEAFNHENYCGTLLWKGASETEIGFFGHADVVPAGDDWTYCEPFNPVVKDGLLFGRGVDDNKGSFLSVLYALKYLKEQGYKPKHSFRFFIGCNEESGMEDVEYYTSHYKEPAFSLVPDVMFPVCNGEKGTLTFDAEKPVKSDKLIDLTAGIMSNQVPAQAQATLILTDPENEKLKETIEGAGGSFEKWEDGSTHISVSGIPAHAAFPEGSESAEVKLADLLLKSGVLEPEGKALMEDICQLFGDYYGAGLNVPFEDKQSGKLTHVGGMARLKDHTFIQNVNIRYNITADYDVLLENIRSCLDNHGFKITKMHHSAPCFTDPQSKEVVALTEICRRYFQTDPSPYVMGGGTYARKLKHAVGFGAGMPGRQKRLGNERGSAHQADEYVEIEHLKKTFLIYVEAIQKLDDIVD